MRRSSGVSSTTYASRLVQFILSAANNGSGSKSKLTTTPRVWHRGLCWLTWIMTLAVHLFSSLNGCLNLPRGCAFGLPSTKLRLGCWATETGWHDSYVFSAVAYHGILNCSLTQSRL